MNSLAIVCACVVTLCLVDSSPVYPNVPRKHFSPTDACLFLCNICFDGMEQEMMDCANSVCMAKDQADMNLGLIQLGRTCKNYSKLDSLVFGKDAE